MATILDHLLVTSLAGLFLYAASFKVLSTSSLRRTLTELGLPSRLASPGARAIPIFELAVGLAVLGFVPTVVASSLVVVATAGIGVAGVVALRKDAAIPCSCFSSQGSGVVGRRQLVMAGALGVAALVLIVRDPRGGVDLSLGRLAVVSVIGSVVHLLMMSRDVVQTVGYRRAAAGVYPS